MLGIDIENVSRFESWTDKQLERIFSPKEIDYSAKFKNKMQHLCGFYCVKEALVKALNDPTLEYKQIEVLHTDSGKPYLNLNAYLKATLEKRNSATAEISISHSGNIAIAVVIVN